MEKNISDDFFSTIRPLFYISRALGLAPFVYVKKTLPGGRISQRFECNSAAFTYSVFVTVLTTFSFSCSIILKATLVYSEMTSIDRIPDIVLSALSIGCTVSLILSLTKNRNKILRIFFLIQELDSILLKNPGKYYRKGRVFVIFQLTIAFFFLGFVITYDSIIWTLAVGVKNFAYIHLYLDIVIGWIVVIQFMNFVIILRDRFSLLNIHLSRLSNIFGIRNPNEGVYQPVLKFIKIKQNKSKLTEEVVLNLNNIHDVLCDTSLLVTSAYEIQLLLTLISTFVSMVTWLYFGLIYFYRYVSGYNTLVGVWNLVVSDMLWCLKHLAKLLCITVPCHLANNEMRQTSVMIRKLHFVARHDSGTLAELDRFSQHVSLRQFKFTAFGFLNLDLSLLMSMLGAVATYLVILMQFKISDKSSSSCCKNVTE